MFFPAEDLIAFCALVALELVLGIDNIVFISIIASRLPKHLQGKARTVGLSLAVITRVAFLVALSWAVGLTAPLFTVWAHPISGRDLILIAGGLFLIAKSTHEIHQSLEGDKAQSDVSKTHSNFYAVIAQILVIDIVFSFDSVITAVGMVNKIPIMVAAVVTATIFMIFCVHSISNFVDRHPTIRMLALSFLVLIGMALILDGFNQHIPKGYIYFAMGYSLIVEALNMRVRKSKS